MPYCHFPISPGPGVGASAWTRNFPGSLAHLSQSPRMSGTVVTMHNVNHVDHVTMPVTVVTVSRLPCCNASMHKVNHNVQLPNFWATVTNVPPHARGVKKGSFSSFTHFPLYPFSVTVVTVDAPWLIHCAWCSAAQKVRIIFVLGVDIVKTAATMATYSQSKGVM